MILPEGTAEKEKQIDKLVAIIDFSNPCKLLSSLKLGEYSAENIDILAILFA